MSRDRDKGVDHSRRAFLRGRPAQTRPLGPPPPCITGRILEPNPCSDCIGQPCLDSCDPDVIRIHPQDHHLAGRAYLSFAESGCTFCGDCFKVCPVADPLSAGRPTPVGLASLSRDLCLPWDGVVCLSCKIACTWDAITFDSQRRPSVQQATCTGCGFCVPVCPTQAINVG